MTLKPKITIVGSGYVGMSLAVLLAQHNEVTVLDIDLSRVEKINNNQSTIIDSDIDLFILNKDKIYSNYFTKNISFISNCISNNLMEILFVKLIIINVGVVLYFIHKN